MLHPLRVIGSRILRALRLVSLTMLAGSAAACAELAGVDVYQLGRCSQDLVDLDGSCQPRCPAGEVPATGGCERVGVDDCGQDFELGADGGCIAHGAPRDCDAGEMSFLGQLKCSPTLCGDIGIGVQNGFSVDRGWRAVWIDPGGTGTDQPAYRSIGDALAAYPDEPLRIGIRSGSFEEALTIKQPIYLLGCTSKVEFRARPTGEPVFSFEAGSDRSHVDGITISGGKGLAAKDIDDFSLANVTVREALGPAISLNASHRARLSRILVERAAGEGITVDSSDDVRIELSNIRDGLLRADGMGGVGILVRPGLSFPDEPPFAIASRSKVRVDRSVIERVRGAGILVEGSELTISQSLVRDVLPDAWGVGRAIDAHKSAIGNEPALLTVDQTVIERAHDAGIRIDGATATIQRATVREVGVAELPAPSADESFANSFACLGAGIRARWNLLRPAGDEPDVVIKNCSITGVREASVTAESVRIVVERSLLRNARATCDGRGGDGLTVYGTPEMPGSASLREVRVEGAARSAIAAFGAPIDVSHSWLAGEGAPIAAQVGTGRIVSNRTACESALGTKACAPALAPIVPVLRGWNSCTADAEHACVDWCFGKFTPDALGDRTSVAGISLWPAHHDGFATQLTDATGCLTYAAPRNRPLAWFSQGGECTASATSGPCPPGAVITGAGVGEFPIDHRQIGTVGVNYWYLFYKPVPPNKPEPQNAVGVAAFACDVTAESAMPWRYCGRFTGLAGARMTIDGADPTHYTTADGVVFGPTAGTSTTATAIFFDVPAGRRVLRIEPMPNADYAGLECSLDWPPGSGWSWGWRRIDPTSFEVLVIPGFVNLAARLWCTRK